MTTLILLLGAAGLAGSQAAVAVVDILLGYTDTAVVAAVVGPQTAVARRLEDFDPLGPVDMDSWASAAQRIPQAFEQLGDQAVLVGIRQVETEPAGQGVVGLVGRTADVDQELPHIHCQARMKMERFHKPPVDSSAAAVDLVVAAGNAVAAGPQIDLDLAGTWDLVAALEDTHQVQLVQLDNQAVAVAAAFDTTAVYRPAASDAVTQADVVVEVGRCSPADTMPSGSARKLYVLFENRSIGCCLSLRTL